MSTIEEIDLTHIKPIANGVNIARQFQPSKYQTYGSARSAMRSLMNGIGYGSLTQTEKEIVGRWSLISDSNEMNLLFGVEEQEEIERFHNSYIKSSQIAAQTVKIFISNYFRIHRLIYKGSIFSEILSIQVDTKVLLSATSYSVRIYDRTNTQTIAERSGLTNTSDEMVDLGDILYQPTDDAILEVQVKVDSGLGEIEFDSITINMI